MNVYIARQPIFDRTLNVHAYELLFRSSLENVFNNNDRDQAASIVISDTLHVLGFDRLTSGKKAFVNVTRSVLLLEQVHLLPSDRTVVELLEDVSPDPDVVLACKKLKRAGYRIALDDYKGDGRPDPLLEIADLVKVDVLATPPDVRRRLATGLSDLGKTLVAEKVETQEMFRETLSQGYGFFQGFFFARPWIVAAKDVPAFKLHYLRILAEIHRPEIDMDAIERVIRCDLSLSYKFLRHINAASFGWIGQIRSIRQALQLLGERDVKKWVTLVALASMAEDKPAELIVQALVRARFAETLAEPAKKGERAQDLFLLGLFSLIDAALDRPMEEILAGIPIADDLKDALLNRRGDLGALYDYVLRYEKGDWEELARIGQALSLPDGASAALYQEAVAWAQRSLASA